MKRAFTGIPKSKALWSLGSLAIVGIVLALLPVFSHKASVGTTATASAATDDFNRADGGLGPGWTGMSGGRLAISSRAVIGTSTSASGAAGDMRTSHAFTSDQYSQVEVTAKQLTGTQWIGSAVRAQRGGQNAYLGIYWWHDGSPELRLFVREIGDLYPDREHVRQRAACRRDQAEAHGRRQYDRFPRERRPAHLGRRQ